MPEKFDVVNAFFAVERIINRRQRESSRWEKFARSNTQNILISDENVQCVQMKQNKAESESLVTHNVPNDIRAKRYDRMEWNEE